MITDRDVCVLRALERYYVLNREQVQRLCFRADVSGRNARRRLQALVDAKYINRTRVEVFRPGSGMPAPVYYPARRGCEFLAEYDGEERHLVTPTQTPQTHHLFHWLSVSETHLTLDAAIAAQSEIALEDWLSEWDTANKNESAPEKRFRIYTLVTDKPRLVCAPDAAFLLALRGHRKVYYLEQDRDTSGVHQIAASKTPGYAALAERFLHRRHFPQTTLDAFSVLMVAPTARRRDALKRALCGKPGAALWRFVAAEELTAGSFLHQPVFHPCEGEPVSLIKPSAAGASS